MKHFQTPKASKSREPPLIQDVIVTFELWDGIWKQEQSFGQQMGKRANVSVEYEVLCNAVYDCHGSSVSQTPPGMK